MKARMREQREKPERDKGGSGGVQRAMERTWRSWAPLRSGTFSVSEILLSSLHVRK